MSGRQWFKFFPGDYLRDTQYLTAEEHGCYLLMIMTYYSTGRPIPNNRFVLSKIFKLSPQKTTKILATLSQLFYEKDGKFYHKKIEAELEKIKQEHIDKSRAGRKGGQASAQARAQAIPEPEPDITTSKSKASIEDLPRKRFAPPTVAEVQCYIDEKNYNVDANRFWHFYESKNWMIGKNKMQKWKSAVANWHNSNKGNSHDKSDTRTSRAERHLEALRNL